MPQRLTIQPPENSSFDLHFSLHLLALIKLANAFRWSELHFISPCRRPYLQSEFFVYYVTSILRLLPLSVFQYCFLLLVFVLVDLQIYHLAITYYIFF